MRIIGNNKDVNMITFAHKNKDIHFQCIPYQIYQTQDLQERVRAEIIFDDIKEIDDLIFMLEKFKKQYTDYIGNWIEVEIY